MAKGFYVGVDNKARKAKKMYVGIDGKARKIKKVYIGVDGKARLCYTLTSSVKVTYSSSKTLSFTSKTIDTGTKYPIPSITPVDAVRADFWVQSGATAKNDSSKKYADYPWCVYADAHPDVYNTYGYAQDRLAKHYWENGASEGRTLGGITPSTVCEKEVDHTLQHVYASHMVSITNDGELQDNYITFATLYYSNGTQARIFETGRDETYVAYPGMYIIFNAVWKEGVIGTTPNNCSITINGVKVQGKGTYKYTIPNNVSKIYMRGQQDIHTNLGYSTVITVTTTTI